MSGDRIIETAMSEKLWNRFFTLLRPRWTEIAMYRLIYRSIGLRYLKKKPGFELPAPTIRYPEVLVLIGPLGRAVLPAHGLSRKNVADKKKSTDRR